MIKPDDSSLDPQDLLAVAQKARLLLDRADAWSVFPVPIDDLLAAAQVKVAPTSIFDPATILTYIKGKAEATGAHIKSAISKILGVYDASETLIHIDTSVGKAKQVFLKLHETGHHSLPTHRKLFRFFQDCEQNLAPEIADQFEREANNFARFVLFKGDTYQRRAADCTFGIRTPINLAKNFGSSVYASAREYARTNARACVIYVLEPIEFSHEVGVRAVVRRIEPSPSFRTQFGCPNDTVITATHVLGRVLPVGRKMVRPTTLAITDRNGVAHECIAEAFDTTHNVLILLYPAKASGVSVGGHRIPLARRILR